MATNKDSEKESTAQGTRQHTTENRMQGCLSCGVPRVCLLLLVTGTLSGTTAVLLLDCFLYCVHTCMYMHMSACIAPMQVSIVMPHLLQICLNVRYLMQRLLANSWLDFTAGHCEAPQRHSRNLSIANASYHGPATTSSTSSRSETVTEAHAVSPDAGVQDGPRTGLYSDSADIKLTVYKYAQVALHAVLRM